MTDYEKLVQEIEKRFNGDNQMSISRLQQTILTYKDPNDDYKEVKQVLVELGVVKKGSFLMVRNGNDH